MSNKSATTSVFKSAFNGWKAETAFELAQTPMGRRMLEITTRKQSGSGLITTATVSIVKDGWASHMVFEDFYETLKLARNARCTEKNVREQHQKVLDEQFETVLAAAKQHYNIT